MTRESLGLVILMGVLGCGSEPVDVLRDGPSPVFSEPDQPARWRMPSSPGSGLENEARYRLSDGVVSDEVTGLSWELGHSEALFGYDQALQQCAAIRIGGFDDWQLPTRIELASLADLRATAPALAEDPFGETAVGFFWSATAVAGDERLAWAQFSYDGATVNADRSLTSSIRCVRGYSGKFNAPEASWREVDSQTVSDAATGLRWQRAASPELLDHAAAQTYCEGLESEGLEREDSRWRLPSVKELQTIVHDGRAEPCIDPILFPSTQPETYWSGTPVITHARAIWGVSFATGATNYNERESHLRVRCVR